MNTQDTSSRISQKTEEERQASSMFAEPKRPHILVRREARRVRRLR